MTAELYQPGDVVEYDFLHETGVIARITDVIRDSENLGDYYGIVVWDNEYLDYRHTTIQDEFIVRKLFTLPENPTPDDVVAFLTSRT